MGSWSGRLIRSQYFETALKASLTEEVPRRRRLNLLQHRTGAAAGKDVAGQTQHGESVHGRGRCPGDHIRGARADRGRASQRTEAVLHFGVARGHVDHALLVAGLVEAEVLPVLQEGLSDARHVAVPEDADGAAEERLSLAIAFDALRAEEAYDGLTHSEAGGGVCVWHKGSFRCERGVSDLAAGLRVARDEWEPTVDSDCGGAAKETLVHPVLADGSGPIPWPRSSGCSSRLLPSPSDLLLGIPSSYRLSELLFTRGLCQGYAKDIVAQTYCPLRGMNV